MRIHEAAFVTLQRLCDESGWPQVDLLDQAIAALAHYFDGHGKTLLTPLDYTRTYQVFEIRIDAARSAITQRRPAVAARPARKIFRETLKDDPTKKAPAR